MFDSLNSVAPVYSGYPLTYDVDANNYATSGKEYLDYLLPVKDYFFPVTSENEVQIFRTIADELFYQNDISDHFAVKGKMEYPYVINQSNIENVCLGSDVILYVNHSHNLYHTWIQTIGDSSFTENNDTLLMSNVQWSDSGNYICKLSYPNGYLFSDTIKVYIHPLPDLLVTQPDTICSSNFFDLGNVFSDLNNTQGTITYWHDSNCVLVSPQVVSESGIYYIKKQSNFGCIDVKSVNVDFSASPLAPIVINNNNVLSVTDVNGSSIQWFFNGQLIANAVDTFLIATQSGFYSVSITGSGCPSVSSSAVQVVISEINEVSSRTDIMIFPNPVHDKLYMNENDGDLVIVDILGNEILEVSENELQIDVSFLAVGVYYIKNNKTEKSFCKCFIKY